MLTRTFGFALLGSLCLSCASGSSPSEDSAGSEAADGDTMPGLGDGQSPSAEEAVPRGVGEAAGLDSVATDPATGAVVSPDGVPGAAFPAAPAAAGPALVPPSDGDALSGAPAPSPGAPAMGGAVAGTPSTPVDDPVAGDSGAIAVPLDPAVDPVTPGAVVEPAPSLQSGLLTAGTWDDNQNFSRFMDYREELFAAQMAGLLPIEESEHVLVQELGIGTPQAHESLDIALVIDTTGSMGDELVYLQTEFSALASAIASAYPNAEQRWSLILYRDVGDEYETRWFDFRDDVNEFRTKLAEQSANGGGDFPEAPHAALEVMTQLAWRTSEAAAKLAFWVADAPHHPQNAAALADAIRTSQSLDVHIYPVASSGVDELTELSMRSAAQLTGGRYVFLTDDSGIGGAHKEPSIPCYFVTRLDHAILRMVDIEMTGEYREPDAAQVIRTGGDPQEGACTLDSGEHVSVF